MSGVQRRWLVAEFCALALFNGWHLYLRDTDRCERNADGSWGWLRRGHHLLPAVRAMRAMLAELGIVMRSGGDGSCDHDGYAELARRYPLDKGRGGVAVQVAGSTITLEVAVRGGS